MTDTEQRKADAHYIQRQFEKLPPPAWYKPRLQLSHEGISTNWLSITHRQVKLIEKILIKG